MRSYVFSMAVADLKWENSSQVQVPQICMVHEQMYNFCFHVCITKMYLQEFMGFLI